MLFSRVGTFNTGMFSFAIFAISVGWNSNMFDCTRLQCWNTL